MSEQFKRLQSALAEKTLVGFKHRTVGGAPAIERASTAKGIKDETCRSPGQSRAED